jgi:dinuclear metal center YbgI/SA1388 family protein
MKINEIVQALEFIAPLPYQETYDNAGLITGNAMWECTGIICTLDATEAVINEAKERGFNLVVAHHPIIFTGLKKITGKNYVEKVVISAIKNDIAIYAIHTNLDNIINGVNKRIADRLQLHNCKVLEPKTGVLKKIYTYVPVNDAEKVRSALFEAGAGDIGNYGECSFNVEGTGTFRAQEGSDPYIGEVGKRTSTKELKLEIIFPAHIQSKVIKALNSSHPYEEVAYDIITLSNEFEQVGSGMTGELLEAVSEEDFLKQLKTSFDLSVIRHTNLLNKQVKKVAICGGAGSFLINNAVAAGADFYITSDVKYHDFFDSNDKLVIADIGHWESEQYTIDLLFDILQSKFPNFAVLKSKVKTNPVNYYV